MNETLLIVLGVAVFTMTLVAVLIYFYALFARLEAEGNPELVDPSTMRVRNPDS